MTTRTPVEYIWVDSLGEVRGKTRILRNNEGKTIPPWRFDGGSTGQGVVSDSDCILSPVRVYSADNMTIIALCEVMKPKGDPHVTNTRARLEDEVSSDEEEIVLGVEQEFTISHLGGSAFFPSLNSDQGNSYCLPTNIGENLVKMHMEMCLMYKLEYDGFNSEVTYGQWEYQIGPSHPMKVADDLIVSRYLLKRIFAYNNIGITFDPKPFDDYNGAGCHINI